MIDAAKIQTGTESLESQTALLMTAMNNVMTKYIDMMNSQGFFDLADENPEVKETMELFSETMKVVKLCEVVGVKWARSQDNIENKLDLIMRKLDQDDLK